ncbi:MAG: hypothetical protein LC687_02385, partial [Actinobacteria bacterium]|nr:hypothetical protein [Actinomycetota bacterium]
MTEEQFQQEMECDFAAAVKGTYYADMISKMEKEDHMGVFPPDYDQPVFASADLGFTDSTAFWFWQLAPDGIRIIDYEEADGKDLTFYFDMLEDKKYNYEEIWLPHDAKAKSLQTGRSTIEQFLAAGFPCKIVPKLSVQHGIDAVRKILPGCYFDQVNCYDGIEALRAYRRTYNEVTKQFGRTPLHDWSSNGADAFRGMALVTQERLQSIKKEGKVAESVFSTPKWQLEPLFKEYE